MDHLQPLWVRATPAVLVLLALTCASVAGLMRVSPRKGQIRLLASLLVAAALSFGGLAQMVSEKALWPAIFGVLAGSFLVWMGFRKYKRDPFGKTPAGKML